MTVEIVDIPEDAAALAVDYIDDVRAVEQAGKAGAVIVPADAVKKHVGKLRLAGQKLDRSVRIVEQTETPDGTRLVFIVTPRATRKRADKPETETAAPEQEQPAKA